MRIHSMGFLLAFLFVPGAGNGPEVSSQIADVENEHQHATRLEVPQDVLIGEAPLPEVPVDDAIAEFEVASNTFQISNQGTISCGGTVDNDADGHADVVNDNVPTNAPNWIVTE